MIVFNQSSFGFFRDHLTENQLKWLHSIKKGDTLTIKYNVFGEVVLSKIPPEVPSNNQHQYLQLAA